MDQQLHLFRGEITHQLSLITNHFRYLYSKVLSCLHFCYRNKNSWWSGPQCQLPHNWNLWLLGAPPKESTFDPPIYFGQLKGAITGDWIPTGMSMVRNKIIITPISVAYKSPKWVVNQLTNQLLTSMDTLVWFGRIGNPPGSFFDPLATHPLGSRSRGNNPWRCGSTPWVSHVPGGITPGGWDHPGKPFKGTIWSN